MNTSAKTASAKSSSLISITPPVLTFPAGHVFTGSLLYTTPAGTEVYDTPSGLPPAVHEQSRRIFALALSHYAQDSYRHNPRFAAMMDDMRAGLPPADACPPAPSALDALFDNFDDPFADDVPVRATFDLRTKASEPCPKCEEPLTAYFEQEMNSYYLGCDKCGYEAFVPVAEGMD